MKIKTSFVTNSSSSSFIVALPKLIKKIEDVQEFIKEFVKAQTVFDDCKKQKPFQIQKEKECYKKIIKELNKGTPMSPQYGTPKDPYYSPRSQQKYFMGEIGDEALYKEIEKEYSHQFYDIYYLNSDIKSTCESAKLAKKFVNHNVGKLLYLFEYGDEDGAHFSEMEHGGTFDAVAHIQVSKH